MGRGGKMEREASKAEEVNNVLNLTERTPCVPVIVRQGRLKGGGAERERV